MSQMRAISVSYTHLELHEFFNAKGERVMYPYPLGTFKENPDLSIEGPQDQVSIGQIKMCIRDRQKIRRISGKN